MRKFCIIILLFATLQANAADEFSNLLRDTTLRIEYSLVSSNMSNSVHQKAMVAYPGWAGRRHNLKKTHLPGQLQVVMQSWATGDTLYMTSQNTLFTEWLALPDSWSKSCSMTVPVQLPMPRERVVMTTSILDNAGESISHVNHEVDPDDILIRKASKNPYATFRIGDTGPVENRIDLVIVPEGYTEEEMDKFREDSQRFADALFSYKPFAENRDKFNITGVEIASRQSGVSVPREGDWRDTAFGTHYDTFYSDRYLTVPDLARVAEKLDGLMYDNIVILANTQTYGGGGFYNSHLLTAAHNPTFREVTVHEFGHSFAGLADEYAYDDDMAGTYATDKEPWEKNITTLVNFESKWADMCDPELGTTPTDKIMEGTDAYTKVGLFEGAGYRSKGVYRPVQECRMRINKAPEFCPVCIRAISETIDFFTAPR